MSKTQSKCGSLTCLEMLKNGRECSYYEADKEFAKVGVLSLNLGRDSRIRKIGYQNENHQSILKNQQNETK